AGRGRLVSEQALTQPPATPGFQGVFEVMSGPVTKLSPGRADMVFKRTEALPAIADVLGAIKSSCEHRGLLHLFDNHTVAQHFFCRLLNAAYDLDLVALDNLEEN